MNKHLKDVGTYRRRRNLGSFLPVLMRWLHHVSLDDEEKGFVSEVQIPPGIWSSAQQFVALDAIRTLLSHVLSHVCYTSFVLIFSHFLLLGVINDFLCPSQDLLKTLPVGTDVNHKQDEYTSALQSAASFQNNGGPTPHNFDDFIVLVRTFHHLQRTQKGYTCTCTNFFRQATCLHSVAFSIAVEHTPIPLAMNSTVVTRPHKRGRPKKANPALVNLP